MTEPSPRADPTSASNPPAPRPAAPAGDPLTPPIMPPAPPLSTPSPDYGYAQPASAPSPDYQYGPAMGASASPYPAPPTSAFPISSVPTTGYGSYAGYGTQPSYPTYAPAVKTNGLAIASMVLSIVGMVLLFCYGAGGLLGLVGAILGHVARRQVRDRAEGGDGMALAGVIVGWIATGLGVVIFGLVVALIWGLANAESTTPYGYYDLLRLYLG